MQPSCSYIPNLERGSLQRESNSKARAHVLFLLHGLYSSRSCSASAGMVACKVSMAHLQSVDVVRHLQLVQLLLYVCNDLQLELGAAQQVKGHTGQQHVDGMLNSNCVSPSSVCTMKGTYSTGVQTSQLAFHLRLPKTGEGPFSG